MMSGWLAKTRVMNATGRRGTVVDEHPVRARCFYAHPIVEWDDDGTRSRMNAENLERSPDDWFARAVRGEP